MKIFLKLVSKFRENPELVRQSVQKSQLEAQEKQLASEMSAMIDQYIEIEDFDRIVEFINSGYKLEYQQSLNLLSQIVDISYSDTKFPIALLEHVAVKHSSEFNIRVSGYTKQKHHRNLWCTLIEHHPTIRNAVSDENLVNLISWLKSAQENRNEQKVQSILSERTSDRHQQMLAKLRRSESSTKLVIGAQLTKSLKDIPPSVSKYIEGIQDNLTKIKVESLSSAQRLELKEIVEMTLPNVIMKYAAIDKNMMDYKNNQNESIEVLLQMSLANIAASVQRYCKTTEAQKVKEFKIAAKMTATR